MSLSVVIPVLDEAKCLEPFLDGLRERLAEGDEIIVVDGGSQDGSPLIARQYADVVLHCDRGRARQMNLGAERAKGDWLWFLHADCGRVKRGHLRALRTLPEDALWGRFDVRLSGDHRLFPMIGHAMNLRSRWTGIATGDQGIFVRRDLFLEMGGFPMQPLMEDVALKMYLLVCSLRMSERNEMMMGSSSLFAGLIWGGHSWHVPSIQRTKLLDDS